MGTFEVTATASYFLQPKANHLPLIDFSHQHFNAASYHPTIHYPRLPINALLLLFHLLFSFLSRLA